MDERDDDCFVGFLDLCIFLIFRREGFCFKVDFCGDEKENKERNAMEDHGLKTKSCFLLLFLLFGERSL